MIEKAASTPTQVRDEAMLKVFAGADATQLLDSQASWHRRKMPELIEELNRSHSSP